MKKIILILLLALSARAYPSECVIAENFKGYIAKQDKNFVFEEDGMTTSKFVIVLDGDKSTIVGSDIQTFIQTSPNSILGISKIDDRSSVETWTIFIQEKKVLYTKTFNWHHPIIKSDGIRAFVGDITGKCQQ